MGPRRCGPRHTLLRLPQSGFHRWADHWLEQDRACNRHLRELDKDESHKRRRRGRNETSSSITSGRWKDLRQIRHGEPWGELVYLLSPTKQSSFLVLSVRPICLRLQEENLSLFSCTSLLAWGNIKYLPLPFSEPRPSQVGPSSCWKQHREGLMSFFFVVFFFFIFSSSEVDLCLFLLINRAIHQGQGILHFSAVLWHDLQPEVITRLTTESLTSDTV